MFTLPISNTIPHSSLFNFIIGDMLIRLCSVAEIKFYFNNYLANLQNGGGYAKPNKNCNISSWVSGCESGWSSTLSPLVQQLSPNEIPARTANSEPCCEGFFCPPGLTCMIRKF